MSIVTTDRRIDGADLGIDGIVAVRGLNDGGWEVEADVPEADLRAEVDAAPDANHLEVKRTQVEQAIADAIARLDQLAAAPALPTVPDGTMTTAQLSNALRVLRDECQATRAGAQEVAVTLRNTIRLVRGDFDDLD